MDAQPAPRPPKPPKHRKMPPSLRYDRQNGLGSAARGLVVTPLGWAHVSPDVLAGLRARGIVPPARADGEPC
jgi:hypothetical protein